jgi:hypothetical protein
MNAPLKKRIGTSSFPAAAFAYVGDATNPDTWQGCLWDQTGLSEVRCLEALDALKRTSIPYPAIPSARAKILNGLKKKGVRIEEAMGTGIEFTSHIRILEADEAITETGPKYIAQVVVLEPGFNKQGGDQARYYPKEVIARDFPIFEGAKVFANHIGRDEEKNRPEGDIMAWVGNLQNVHINESGAAVGDIVVHDKAMREKLTSLKEVGMLNQMGVSVHALGTAIRKVVEGVSTFVVESFQKVRSVDFVTAPGAGGRVLLYESLVDGTTSSKGNKEKSNMRNRIREAEGDPAVGDLGEPGMGETGMPTIEDLQAQLAALTAENAALKEELAKLKPGDTPPVSEAPVQEAIREVKAMRQENAQNRFALAMREALLDSNLPRPAQIRILESTQGGTDVSSIPGIISKERQYVLGLREAASIRGCGGGAPRDEDNDTVSKEETFQECVRDYQEQGHDLGTATRMAKGFLRV